MEGRQGDVSIDAGIQATQGMSLSKPRPYPAWSDQARGGISFFDLPLQDVKCDSAKHIVDIISDVPPPDKTAIEAAINSGHWGKDRLPEPFCVKSDIEVKLIKQFVVIPRNNGNACLESLCYGTPYVLKWQGHAQNFRRGFQWFLEQLGGWQCQYALTHQPRDGSKGGSYMANLSEEAVDKGFAFIEEEASRLGTEWKCVQWMTKNLNTTPESPIYAWPQDVEYSVLDFAVRHMLKHMKTHSNGFVGSPGSGKTPLASEFDFFRGQAGRKADEATFDKGDISTSVEFKHLIKDKKSTWMWEQWAGVVQRGRPETLVLHRLNPKVTVKKAPGPGAIRKIEWQTLGNKLLKGRKVVLHTDSAKSYKAYIDGVIHDRVVHCKKRVKVNGRFKWINPKYVGIVEHKTPGAQKILYCKSGTQVIDRACRFLEDRIVISQNCKAGSKLLRANLRSAQYEYWNKNADLWLHTGVLCHAHTQRMLAE
ncbi:unnamed protein product [Symbiodinium sp. CCMP2592]|nr:unnamed protein product [Symbiodinium sp. CCMP2592]